MLCRPLILFFMLAYCGLALACPATEVRAQALEQLREDVRTSSPDEPEEREQPRNSSGGGSGYDDCDDDWGDLLAFAIVAPFWGPAAMMGDDYSERGYFLHFPHQHDRGYMVMGAAGIGELPGGQQPYVWAARGRTEYGTDFDRLNWIGGHLLFETSPRLGLESDFRHVNEDLAAGRDALWFGDGNALFRFAQSEWLVMRSGVGFNFLSDARRTDFGFNFTYGGDFFPIRPLVISGELDLGTLGHTSVYHFRGTIGANWRTTEAYIGYDYYDIGRTQIAGLVAGVRLWY
jgi:hypothetical protein